MKRILTLLLAVLAGLAPLSLGQEPKPNTASEKNQGLEKLLADVNLQWVCAGPYHKNRAQDRVDFKSKFWPDQFFEISRQGELTDKKQMVAMQTATATAHPNSPPGTGPNPERFKLMAVYGNVALATDRTVFKAVDANGKLYVTDQATVLRMFVELDGNWRPAGAALVPVK